MLGSKPATEPGMVLGAGAFFALKMAIYAARDDQDGSTAAAAGWFELPIPATPARVQGACCVNIADAL